MATEAEIQNANRVVDQWFLGKTSKHHESGNAGPAAISSGHGDHGGISYGSYQLASNTGTLALYLKVTNNYHGAFDGLTPKTSAFDAKWRDLATHDPKFHESQHDFIASRHYQPLSERLTAVGYDFSSRGRAVQDMIWSTAVQYGGGSSTVDKFRRAEKESQLDFSVATDKEIITAVQDSKYRHYQEDFQSSHGNWKGISNRILEEKNSLIRLSEQEQIVNHPLREMDKNTVIPNSDSQNQPNPFANPDNFGALETPSLSPVAQTIKEQCHSHVHGFCERNNQKWTPGMDNTFMALAVVAREAQMSGVDALGVSQGTIYIAQTDRKGIYREAEINAHEAANIPFEQSQQRLAIIDQQMLVQEQRVLNNPIQTLNQVQSGPRVG